MARFRLSGPARADLAGILATSLERWGEDGRARYAALLAAAMRSIAAAPEAPATRDRAELVPGVRSFHVRQVRGAHGVKTPVHVLYFRVTSSSVIEIVRVLHERMEPSLHLPSKKAPRPHKHRGRRR